MEIIKCFEVNEMHTHTPTHIDTCSYTYIQKPGGVN